MVIPKHGRGKLRVGGTNPGAGRPRDEWKSLCAGLASSAERLDTAKKVLDNPEHPAWLGAWKFVAEQAYGRPDQNTTLSGDQAKPLRIVIEREAARDER